MAIKYSRSNELPTGTAKGPLIHACLCLEGGAFRGVYTSGVLDVLMEAGILVDTVIGVSAGAMNGANYTSGQIGRSARINLNYRHDNRYVGIKPFFTDKGIVGFDFALHKINDILPFDFEAFNDPRKRYITVATNVMTGKPDYLERGKVSDVFDAIKASASMPYVSAPVEVGGNFYLDGGCTVNIPFQWALDNDFEKIIVVKTRDAMYNCPPMSEKTANVIDRMYGDKFPAFAKAYKRDTIKYNDELYNIRQLKNVGRIFVIEPSFELNIGRLEPDMEKLGNLYFMGRADTVSLLPSIKNYLGI